jgi:hypothetical protein
MTAFTFTQPHPGGRILLMLGQHQAGAVFPPGGVHDPGLSWRWSFWLGSFGTSFREGRAKGELAAKNAILAEAKDWLAKAGVQ